MGTPKTSAMSLNWLVRVSPPFSSAPENRRRARFVCAASLASPGVERTLLGEVSGVILDAARGSGGFGYDPVFYYEPLGKTFAEWNRDELVDYLNSQGVIAAPSRCLAAA